MFSTCQERAPVSVRRVEGEATCQAVSDELQRMMQRREPVVLARLKETESLALQIVKAARMNTSYKYEIE